jgi:uncharacterized protein (UPF0264 family)
VIDAKNPRAGALGAVTLDVLRDIYAAVAGTRPVTAALGDATREGVVEADSSAFAAAGARFVKVGFAGIESAPRIAALIAAAVRGAAVGSDGGASVVAVTYADADRVGSMPPESFVAIASGAGARGVLLDTADKSGPGLRRLMTPERLADWVADVHSAGLFTAVAGQLVADDLAFVQDAGADIAGVRGAACEGGRTGRVSADRVLRLRSLCERQPASASRTVSI